MGENKGKQLNLSKRKIIRNCLYECKNATEIGNILNVHKSTVTREVMHYRSKDANEDKNPSFCSNCKNVNSCKKRKMCGSLMCSIRCAGCKQIKQCEDKIVYTCHIENRFPGICIDCAYQKYCAKNKYSYDPIKADESASALRVHSRIGLNMTREEHEQLNAVVKEGVKRGQSIFHIVTANGLNRTVRSIYNYINRRQITVKPIDLPRAVTLKVRKKKELSPYEYKENKNIDRSGRMYSDWLVFRAKKKIICYWQMDFLGCPQEREQCILVFSIPDIQFVCLIVLSKTTRERVKKTFDEIENKMGNDLPRVFEAILTDRDTKFSHFKELEINEDTGECRTKVFFCDPARSNQKPSVENMNQQLRIVFPKGVRIENITQEQCDIFSSNYNSRYLNSIDGKRSCDLFINIYGEEVYKKLNLKIIEPKDLKIIDFRKN